MRLRRLSSIAAVLAITAVPLLVASTTKPSHRPAIRPQVPSANRSAGNRVFLEHADILNKQTSDEYMVVSGNVVFSKRPDDNEDAIVLITINLRSQ